MIESSEIINKVKKFWVINSKNYVIMFGSGIPTIDWNNLKSPSEETGITYSFFWIW